MRSLIMQWQESGSKQILIQHLNETKFLMAGMAVYVSSMVAKVSEITSYLSGFTYFIFKSVDLKSLCLSCF